MKVHPNHWFILKITLLIVSSFASVWLFFKALYFLAGFLLLLVIGLGILLYKDRQKLINKMDRMILGIRHADFSFSFTDEKSKSETDRLHREMNEALNIFRIHMQNKIVDETETQAWQKLISVLTHEIMNSIAPIISLSENLSERDMSESVDFQKYDTMQQAMEIIHRRSKGLLTFVENYRKVTRTPTPVLQPIRLDQMLNSLQQLTAPDKLFFTYSVCPKHLIINADRNMLEQMLINLLKNAHDACTNEEPKIMVKASKIGTQTHISVTDNGSGIAPEIIDKIFIPFYSTKTNGSGIGLSLCRQMMLRHRGKITAESSEKGSVFTLIFMKE